MRETLQRTRQEHDQLVEKSDEVIENKGSCVAKAMGILLGAAAVAVLAEPFVDTIHNFSNAIRIPSFFVSFIAIPLSTKSNEAISVIFTACRKKQRSASLAFSEVRAVVASPYKNIERDSAPPL